MRKALIVLFTALAAGAAQAQVQCWTTKDGKRECGDTPPAGARVREIRTPAAPAPAAPATKDAAAKDAKKGPLTPAEQEQAFRKRQIDGDKAREKENKALADAAAKKENCDRARQAQLGLESGQRIARTDASGERYYLDEAQVAAEIAKARQLVQQWCN
ncbi:MAG: hypothetical protein A2Z64_06230 [Betaproteobacteria bacterium RIFCSPLOWO2_02_67_12]|nr:MAG: hypothetical protein A2Z64_06230 [Betaproteobacteria bacterium RIFCSPLOWO2_02_67_12]OGA72502.1 MAG: hypothetical protein A3F77_09300 [Betaproteobacteria bacterium RIFCSPLOWO2_12_FULL_67_28]